MIDIHTHILFNVDDGCTTLEESIKQINKAYENGVKSIVLTPHFIENSKFNSSLENNIKNFKILKSKITNVDLYLGNECYITDDIIDLLEKKQITTINNSRYLLVEFPRLGKVIDLEQRLFNLVKNNITPIICHPERYYIYQQNPELIVNLINLGCLIQINAFSLLGIYSTNAKKTAKYFIKHKLVDFIATDTHEKDFYNDLNKIKNMINKDYYNLITYINPNKVINDIEIEKTYTF